MAAAPQGYNAGMSLGGATFTLAVDAGSFDRELARAGTTAAKVSQDIGRQLGRGGGAAQGLLYLGQAVDDVQYGFHSIVNNIPQIAMAMGGGAGLAGAVGIAAVATNQLLNHWDDLSKLWQTEIVQQQAAAMGELAEKTKDAADQADKLLKATPDSTKGAGAAINEAAVEAGSKNVLDAIEAALTREAPKPGTGAKHKFLSVFGYGGTKAEDEKAKIKEQARFLLGSMATDEGSRAAVEGLFRRNTPEFAGVPGFAAAVGRNSPANVAEGAMLTKEGRANEAILRLSEAAQKLADAKRDAETKQLNEQGMANQQFLVAQLEVERHAMQQQLQRRQDAVNAIEPAQKFGSMREYLSSITTAGADSMRKAQVDELKAIHKGIDKLNDRIFALNKAKFN